jgi:hypothetical protein
VAGGNSLNKGIENAGVKPADGAREEYEDEGAGERGLEGDGK